ncbi:TPA: hypothetical protein L6A81_12415 [Pseudomonas aeruginosa]|nr:hypothetical protein [Pseudomonas aeruginosa]
MIIRPAKRVILALCLALGGASVTPITTYAAEPEQVARCFFVYSPIYEVAKRRSDQALLAYATPRMAWLAGYFEANRNNKVVADQFKASGTANKAAGIRLEGQVVKSLDDRAAGIPGADEALTKALKPAEECDQALDLQGK